MSNAPVIDGGRENPYTTHDSAGIASWSGARVLGDAEVNSYESALELHERVRWGVHQGRLGFNRRRSTY